MLTFWSIRAEITWCAASRRHLQSVQEHVGKILLWLSTRAFVAYLGCKILEESQIMRKHFTERR